MPTHVEAPDGQVIEFPDAMDNGAITGAMQKLYPPRPALVWPPSKDMPSPQALMPKSVSPMPNTTQVQDIDKTPQLSPYAKPGPYKTQLTVPQEDQFQSWVKQNKVPWEDSPTADYDMRGYWKAKQSGNPLAMQQKSQFDGTMHFPDTYKTPFHKTFSNESMYAKPDAPHWDEDKLVDSKGNVVADETAPSLVQKGATDPTSHGVLSDLWESVKAMMDMHMAPSLIPGGHGGPMVNPGATNEDAIAGVTGYKGYPQMYQGVKELGQGNKLRDPNAAMKGAADILGGGMTAATPLMLGAGLENPLPMIKGLLTSTASSYGAQKLTEYAGGSPEAQELAAQLGGMLPMAHGTKEALTSSRPEVPMQQAVKAEVSSAQGSAGPLLDRTENSWHEHKSSDIGPSPEVDLRANRPGSLIDEYADMKEAEQTQAQKDQGRQRFLNNQANIKANYSQTLGPAKTYDPVSGEPIAPSSSKSTSSAQASSVETPGSGEQSSLTSSPAKATKSVSPDLAIHETKISSSYARRIPDTLHIDFSSKGDLGGATSSREVAEKLFPEHVDNIASAELSKYATVKDRFKLRVEFHDADSAQSASRSLEGLMNKSLPSGKGLGPSGAFKSIPEGKEGERGSLSFRKTKPTVYPSNSPMGRLANDVAKEIHTNLPDDADRLGYGERMAAKYGEISDSITDSLHAMLGHTIAKASEIMRPPEVDGYVKNKGRFSGDLNRNNIETRRFVNNIIKQVPDKLRREAITNYMNAAGDDDLLRRQAESTTNKRLQRGYEVARNLTQTEKNISDKVRDYFDTQLSVGQQHGFLHAGIEDYLPNVWKGSKFPSDLLSSARNYDLRPNAQFMKNRFFTDYFHGEQLGYEPKDKDIGTLVAAYNQSFNKAVSSRAFVERLKTVNMPDGRPAVAAPAAMGKTFNPSPDDIVHIIGRGFPDEKLKGFRPLDHPALQGHQWATNTDSGDPVFYRGSLLVHPDVLSDLDNVLKSSSVRKNPVAKAVLQVSGMAKATTLSVGSFHQVQEGIHAIFHGVSPFSPSKIDLTDSVTNKLFDSGLVAGGDNGFADFSEGLQGPGLLKGVPGVGVMLHKYSNYLFNDYIPRLKVEMAKGAYERNTKRYKGDLSDDQIAKLSAEQSNAAFGELNYKMLGRNPNTQDVFRLIALAPDFLEARARFVGQAMKPYGAEQRVALVRGALGMYVVARVLNKILDDDYHYDKPFGVVHGGKEYELRSLPGDIYNLVNDPRSFTMHRLNPTVGRATFEALSGKDSFGRKRDAEGQIIDFAKNMVPIPAQGVYDKYTNKGFKEQSYFNDALGAAGISTRTYRTPAATLARQIVLDHMDPAAESRGISYIAAKIQKGKYDPDEVNDMLSSGRMTGKDLVSAFKLAKSPELVRNFNNENVHLKEAVTIYAAAHPDERALLAPSMYKKMKGLSKLPPAEQADIIKRFNAIKTSD